MRAYTHYQKQRKEAKRKRHAYEEKRAWVIALLMKRWDNEKRHNVPPGRPFVCASDEEDQEAWEAAFGGKVVIYTLGPSISPDFARTLRRMFEDGDLARSTIGNQDARSYGQKTYCVSYTFKTWPLKD